MLQPTALNPNTSTTSAPKPTRIGTPMKDVLAQREASERRRLADQERLKASGEIQDTRQRLLLELERAEKELAAAQETATAMPDLPGIERQLVGPFAGATVFGAGLAVGMPMPAAMGNAIFAAMLHALLNELQARTSVRAAQPRLPHGLPWWLGATSATMATAALARIEAGQLMTGEMATLRSLALGLGSGVIAFATTWWWRTQARAVHEAWLGGRRVAKAEADVVRARQGVERFHVEELDLHTTDGERIAAVYERDGN